MKTRSSTGIKRVWLTLLVLFTALASAAAADERAKRDADNAVQLCAELTKITPAGWQFANRMRITPSVSRDPRPTFVIESATPLPFKHLEIGALPRADDESEKPPVLKRVDIRLVAMPYLSPDECAAAAKRNEQGSQRRLEFERLHLRDVPYTWKGPRPFPPWAYAMQDARGQQLDSLRQYLFVWLRTEPVLLPSHYYKTLAFRIETSPWGTISDKQKMKEYRDILAAMQQIVVPYDKATSGEFLGDAPSQ